MNEDVVELEFRDGKRWVPKHLALTMTSLDTYRLTYRDACKQANSAAVQRHVDDKFNEIIGAHFKRLR